ncbi:MAG: endonuclease/exonuclease/phosphatase family protein [Bdellovibrio sp.]
MLRLSALVMVLMTIMMSRDGKTQEMSSWEPDSRPPQLCVQNFNAYGPIYAAKVRERTEQMLYAFRTRPMCDVIQLQEVWNESQQSQLEAGLHDRYAVSSPNRDSRIGLMSFFMGEILEKSTEEFRLNSDGGILDSVRGVFGVKKAFHVVRVRFPHIDEEIYFLNMHLHPSSQEVRLAQIKQMAEWRRSHSDLKLIMTGDLNAEPDSLERKTLLTLLEVRDALEDYVSSSRGLCTYCTGNPLGWSLTPKLFDYIFYSNKGKSDTHLEVLKVEINLRGPSWRRPLSDHYGLKAHWTLKKGAW